MPAKRGPKVRNVHTAKPRPAAGLWEGFTPPADMTKPALSEFRRLTSALRRVGTLDRTDPQTVVTAARLQALQDKAFATIEDEGLTLTGGHGSPMAHPLTALVNSLTIRLRALKNDMGLTATAAKYGDTAKDDGGDGWSDLLVVG